jgi:hypothetical protein
VGKLYAGGRFDADPGRLFRERTLDRLQTREKKNFTKIGPNSANFWGIGMRSASQRPQM